MSKLTTWACPLFSNAAQLFGLGLVAAVSAGVRQQAVTFGYDSLNRRVGKAVYDYNAAGNGTWQLTQSLKYLKYGRETRNLIVA